MSEKNEEMSKPRREEHTVRLTSYQVKIAKTLADKQSRAFADVLSAAVEIGLDTLIDRDNKVNIWERTSEKNEIRDLVDAIPRRKYEDAIAYLKGLKEEK